MASVAAVIPAFNRRHLLGRSLGSVLAQTRRADDIIVVDDGSTDGTAEWLAATYPGVLRCVRQPNSGVSSARNAGLAAASCDYVAFLDSDDEWLPGHLELMLEAAEQAPDAGLILSDVECVDGDGVPLQTIRRRAHLPRDGRVLADVVLQPALFPSSALVKRTDLLAIGGFNVELRTAEDIDLHLRLARRTAIRVVPEVLTRYYVAVPDGLSALDQTPHDYVRVVERFLASAGRELPSAAARRARCNAYAKNAVSSALVGHQRKAVAYLLHALRNSRDAGDVARTLNAALRVVRSRLRPRPPAREAASGRAGRQQNPGP